MTDRHLQKLWRKAVLRHWYNRCILCGNTNVDEIECHHVVKRRVAILRHDYRNGVPVCKKECHRFIDSRAGEDKLRELLPNYQLKYLAEMEQVKIKDHLMEQGISRAEFLKQMAEELKRRINE